MTKIANYLLKKEFFKEKYLLKFFYIIIVLAIMISFFYNIQTVQASDRKISILYFNNEEAIDYFQKIIKKMGLEKALIKKGIKEGDQVKIKEIVFTFSSK